MTTTDEPITVAYADPPYLGMGHRYDHPDASDWDSIEHYYRFIKSLCSDYPDGWALSASSSSLYTLLPFCPEDVRIQVWVKPFAAFKKNVNPAFAWEPVLIVGGRPRGDEMTYMRDFAVQNIELKKGLTGAKPEQIMFWIFDSMNLRPGDTVLDLFPGTGAVSRAWQKYEETYPDNASYVNRISSSWEMVKGPDRHADLPD